MKRLLLIGGGHAQVEVLRRFGEKREPGVSITVVSPSRHTPYSGMLPGFVAGHYRWEEIHVDLRPLAARADAKLVQTTVQSLDTGAQVATCADGSRQPYDVCSIDIGSMPRMDAPGAREHAIPVKPVEGFLARWLEATRGASSIAVVGGGAGGVEVLLAMQRALSVQLLAAVPHFHLLTDTPHILPGHRPLVRAIFERVLEQRNVTVHCSARVDAVEQGVVRCADGRTISADAIFWATGASAAAWIAESGVAIDRGGFMRVDAHLRSPSHPAIFGSGDVIALDGMRLPKSGVFAVRQGPVLADNLRAALTDAPQKPFITEPNALNLISTGDRQAVMAWHDYAIGPSRAVWRWKDWIDRRFMRRYR